MDQTDKASIASVLVREPEEARKRLVLGLASPSGTVLKVRPTSFKDRKQYRAALVEHQRHAQQTYVDEVASELTELGLAVRTFPLTNTIVVEGLAHLLAFALDHKRVATAALDEELTLIEPVKR